MEPGVITKLDIHEILPFSNYLVKFSCTGEQLLAFVQENAQASASRTHGIMQVSGLEYKYKIDIDENVHINSVFVNGDKVQNEKIYSAHQAIQRLNRVVPQIQTELIPDAGHDLTIVQAEIVNRIILEFLNQP